MKVKNKLESGIWNLEFESLKFAICNVKEGRKGSLREGEVGLGREGGEITHQCLP